MTRPDFLATHGRPSVVTERVPVSLRTAYRLLADGTIASVRIRGSLWVDLASLDTYVAALTDRHAA